MMAATHSTTLFRQLLAAPDDPARWQAFVNHYGPWVRRWVRSRLGRDDAADELTNDLFFKIYLNLGSLHSDRGSLRPWISTVIFRQIRSWQRRQRRDRSRPLDSANWADLQTPDAIRELEEYLDTSEYADRYLDAMRSMQEQTRFHPLTIAVFLAQVRDGREAGAVAEQYGISSSAAVKYKFRVARAILDLMGLPDNRESLGLLCRIVRVQLPAMEPLSVGGSRSIPATGNSV
jgi:RNA polymerase sigma factor (sigma-70 family)